MEKVVFIISAKYDSQILGPCDLKRGFESVLISTDGVDEYHVDVAEIENV